MKEVMIEQERKAGQSTLIQTYNGDDLLLVHALLHQLMHVLRRLQDAVQFARAP